ncbi:molybdopterin/thiamine biosynthesis adenylyltransferase [Alkalispirillum mobile]|uniref:Molybdopterin/thiamine biosynthesis adenylyltransferase n=1 Tax=Alkalispirillum mobile TaxID=85925 RepID=A0A498CH03_9GAMM|nr:ThiF family adenylyltransferase [Alkalispirillum mobile]RLK51608.1 molybdopterin/thiamine biosynthesis adenylyltransferase [Alkalispirillum mobile]
MGGFDYRTAFTRNVGWVTEKELEVLRGARVAIAGLGGVGGAHLLTLARLGIGAFNISDFDVFELHNMNRQVGASMRHLGEPKARVLAAMAQDINPELDMRVFPDGVREGNLTEFLEGVDVYVDGLDFFAFEARRQVFAAVARAGIPAVTVAPLGMGAALLNFHPERMSFDAYFDLRDGLSDEDLALRFMMGLAPAMLHMGYLADPDAVDLGRQRGPSTPMACDLCAGVMGTEVLKLLLNRGRVVWAPRGVHFDAYRQRLAHTWRPGGNRNPLQRVLIAIARRRLARLRLARQPLQSGGDG